MADVRFPFHVPAFGMRFVPPLLRYVPVLAARHTALTLTNCSFLPSARPYAIVFVIIFLSVNSTLCTDR
jgi:hypothetical protein